MAPAASLLSSGFGLFRVALPTAEAAPTCPPTTAAEPPKAPDSSRTAVETEASISSGEQKTQGFSLFGNMLGFQKPAAAPGTSDEKLAPDTKGTQINKTDDPPLTQGRETDKARVDTIPTTVESSGPGSSTAQDGFLTGLSFLWGTKSASAIEEEKRQLEADEAISKRLLSMSAAPSISVCEGTKQQEEDEALNDVVRCPKTVTPIKRNVNTIAAKLAALRESSASANIADTNKK